MIEDLTLIRYKKKKPQSSCLQDLLPLGLGSEVKVKRSLSLVEKALLSRLKDGDTSAFTVIFSGYYKDLVMFATRFTHNINDAEEIIQDIFVKFWEEHESVNIAVSLKSFLLKTVQNKCIDWLRHNKVARIHNDYIVSGSTQIEYDADNYMLFSELQEQIDASLARLPEEISEAFRMNRYKGLKYHEIAKLTGVSVRTVEVRIGKALNMLRNYLKEYLLNIAGLLILLFCNT
jgi:RNA polymerase sigma-70 factor, ECF subfamily